MAWAVNKVLPQCYHATNYSTIYLQAEDNLFCFCVVTPAGSSTQVGVLVVPFCVVLAWMMGRPLDLNFNEFEALVLFVSVLLAALMVQVRPHARGWGARSG